MNTGRRCRQNGRQMMAEPKSVKVRLGCDEADDELFIVNPSVQTRRDDLESGEVSLSIPAQTKLRELLSIPAGLSAEEAEVAQIERRLEEARVADVCDGVSYHPPHKSGNMRGYDYCVWQGGISTHHCKATRLAAAQAALAHVEKLEAEAAAKKRPEPEAMATGDVRDELRGRGWRFGFNEDHWFWQNASGFCVYIQDEETRCSFERRALRRARELADGA